MKVPVYVSASARKLLPSGAVLFEVIPDLEETQPEIKPKRPRSQRQIMRAFQRAIWKRARTRGLVSQTEMLARLEDDFEQRLVDWEWDEGADVDMSYPNDSR